jgi:diaminohydroxyphosphoribosylaminopyrimidine deaminase/5-amino-6-(5-phosphoribosylamino)uracil reductase
VNARPRVTLKVAATLDGFIAPARAARQHWITGPAARAVAHELRAAHDAVLVGAGTVLADNPRLTVRDAPRKAKTQPLRVVLDGRLLTPPRARLLHTPAAAPPLVIGRARPRDPALAQRARGLERAGAEVLLLPGRAGERVPLPSVLEALAARGVRSLLVEGGSRVLGEFIHARLADAVAFFLAPRLAGSGVPIVQGEGLDWRSPIVLGPLTTRIVGDDLLITADVASPRPRAR